MPEHRIRLNRAWEIRAAPLDFHFGHEEAAALLKAPIEERIDLPLIVDDEPADEAGRPVKLLLTRWFNGPSNLRPGQEVRLVVEPAEIVSQLQVNKCVAVESAAGGTGVSPVSHRRDACATRASFDLTDKLQRHNRLDILVGVPHALAEANIALAITDSP